MGTQVRFTFLELIHLQKLEKYMTGLDMSGSLSLE